MAHPFSGLDGNPRSLKPRTRGRTMVADWGLGLSAQQDLLTTAAEYFEFAKVAVGISRLLPSDIFIAKIRTYQAHGVEPFPGGQYLEYAEVEGKAEHYLQAVREAGYRWVEVSDNLLSDTAGWKPAMIRMAREQFGLSVLGEVGKKEGLSGTVAFADDARACLDAGAEIVLLEAAELVSDDAARSGLLYSGELSYPGLRSRSRQTSGFMFELPGPWIAGVNPSDVHQMRRRLIDRYWRVGE